MEQYRMDKGKSAGSAGKSHVAFNNEQDGSSLRKSIGPFKSPINHPESWSTCPPQLRTCCTSRPRAQTSVVMSTRADPALNSAMIASRSFCTMSPCMDATVKLFCRIFSVNQSTFRLVLQKMTACKRLESGRP